MRRGGCLAPPGAGDGCAGRIVQAHTVPRSSLTRISDDGHVLSFHVDVGQLKKHGSAIWPQPRGIRKASVFTGFCAKHDNDLFEPLERERFAANPHQCFLLAYRAIARELYLKTNTRAHFERRLPDIVRQRGVPPGFVEGMKLFTRGTALGEAELRLEKDEYDSAFAASDYRRVNAYVIELHSAPPVMSSGCFVPEHTFEGSQLWTFTTRIARRRPEMTISSFADINGRGFLVFAWLDDVEGHAVAFVDSLEDIADSQLTGPLLRFMFEYCDNIHINPVWWRELGLRAQRALVQHMDMASEFDPSREARDFYSDDGIAYPTWSVRDRYSLVSG